MSEKVNSSRHISLTFSVLSRNVTSDEFLAKKIIWLITIKTDFRHCQTKRIAMHVSTNITGLPILRNKGKCYMTHLPLQVNPNRSLDRT